MGARDIIEAASRNSQTVVFGDTHHSYIPLWPMSENFDALKASGKDIYFIEQHYLLQPAIEKYAAGDMNRREFIEASGPFNEDAMWGHSEFADSIMAAIDQGMRVVAFDTRSTEDIGVDPAFEIPPSQVPEFPQDLLPAIQKAYNQRDSVNFDRRSAEAVSSITGDQGAVVWIGNRHINGTHLDGDSEGDFDAYLKGSVARIAMFNDEIHYAEYSGREDIATKGVEACAVSDQPDFIYFVAHDVGFATQSAMTRGFTLDDTMMVADVPSLCYSTDNPRVIEPNSQNLSPSAPKPGG